MSAPAAAANDRTDAVLARALDKERRRNARWLGSIRLACVGAIFAVALWQGLARGRADWRAELPLFGAYALLSAALALVAWRRPSLHRPAALGLAFVDVPMAFLIQGGAAPAAPAAAFALGLFCAFVLLAALALDRGLVVAVAGAGTVLEVVLLRRAG
ncbi:MAG: hypothetical protein KGM24_11600, partial [Elusimicrobia bacterium]|nr:hypothetical protein [Elusimicrobiota bacterium]